MGKYDFVITVRGVEADDPAEVAEDVISQIAAEGIFDDVTIEVYETEALPVFADVPLNLDPEDFDPDYE